MDRIRVLRILEYEGPRAWVEQTLEQNSVKGEYKIMWHTGEDAYIREAVIGTFPEILRQKSETENAN